MKKCVFLNVAFQLKLKGQLISTMDVWRESERDGFFGRVGEGRDTEKGERDEEIKGGKHGIILSSTVFLFIIFVF